MSQKTERARRLLEDRPERRHYWYNAQRAWCGVEHPAAATNDPEAVTCGNCQRCIRRLKRWGEMP